MPKKPRCSSCSSGWCKNHLFQLNPLLTNLYYKKNFRTRLCPRFNKQLNKFEKTMPIFNRDNKFYTPSFYLDEENKYYLENDERVLRNHHLKVEEDINQNETIYIPRHARKRNYCFVCRTDYNDYLDHLSDPLHRKSIKNNHFTSLIAEIQKKFTQQNIPFIQMKKQDQLKRQAPTEQSSSLSEPNPKSFDFIRKLIKPSEHVELDLDIDLDLDQDNLDNENINNEVLDHQLIHNEIDEQL